MQNYKVYYIPNSNDAFVKETDTDKAIKDAYNKAIDEIKRAINGKEYWCV